MSLWKHRSPGQHAAPNIGQVNPTLRNMWPVFRHVPFSWLSLLKLPINIDLSIEPGIVFTYKHTSAISCFQAATRWQPHLSTKVRTMFKRSKQILNRSNSQDYHDELDKLLPSIYFQTLVLNEGIKINIFITGNSIKMFRPVKVWYLFINLHNDY